MPVLDRRTDLYRKDMQRKAEAEVIQFQPRNIKLELLAATLARIADRTVTATMTTTDLDLTADVVYVRDVIARVEELRDERANLQLAIEDTEAERSESDTPTTQAGFAAADVKFEEAKDALADWCAGEEGQEYAALTSLLDGLAGNGGDEQWEGDWYPATLIRDSYFETAMDELLEDCGDLPKNLPCYLKVTVDYDALQMDYTRIEIDGETYWYR